MGGTVTASRYIPLYDHKHSNFIMRILYIHLSSDIKLIIISHIYLGIPAPHQFPDGHRGGMIRVWETDDNNEVLGDGHDSNDTCSYLPISPLLAAPTPSPSHLDMTLM